VMLHSKALEEVDTFAYLGSIMAPNGGAEADTKSRISKARYAFHQLKKIWASRNIGIHTKLRLFRSNVKSVLLYGAETWRTTKTTLQTVQAFINRCLRRILNIFWPETISNKELWTRTGEVTVEVAIRRRRWSWLGHTLRKPEDSITRQALTWNPQGKRRRGRPRNTWRRELEVEVKKTGLSWKEVERVAQDRNRWRVVVDGLCSRRSDGTK